MILRRVGVALGIATLVATTALPACSTTANVSDVWMSIDEDGARRRTVFFTDSESVVCIAELGIGREDVTVEMLIRRIRGTDFGEREFREENTVVMGNDFRPGRTQGTPGRGILQLVPTKEEEGRLVQDDEAPFAPGSYICEVRLDGELKGTAAFNIDYPDCPVAMILQDQRCAGFYPLGTTCPQAGLTGDQDPVCECTEEGWDCG